MASQSNVRDTPTLIKRGADYSSGKKRELIDWLLMLEQKENVLTLQPSKNGAGTLLKNDDFRIDYQGYFNSNPYEIGWINLQVQENTPRKSNTSTTVITTYVHYQGYHHKPGRITGNIILRAMVQQAMHNIGEYSVFVSKSQEGAIVVQNIPRSPQGLIKYGWGSLEDAKRVQGQEWNNPKKKGKWASIWVPKD
ncbi:hypothetical protein N7501_000964 [Penicillium viridicatum]|nr:hypothetical protein N7501_000964 [Penicillium viridicatum]